MNTGWVFIEKWVELVRLVVDRKMFKTSKGRGLTEKWQKNDKNENGVAHSRKQDRMNTGWVFMEKCVEVVSLVVGRKMGKTSKGRGLPEKWQKNNENENGIGSSSKHDKMNTGWVFIEKWVELVRLVVGRKMGKMSKGRGVT